MISEFRKKFHSPDNKSSTTAIAVLFALALILPQFVEQVRLSGQWAMSVNGNKIGVKQFVDRYQKEARFLDMLKQQLGGQFSLSQLGIVDDPVQRTVQALLVDTLSNETANQINLEINPETIKKKIIEILPAGKTLNEIAKMKGEKIVDLEEAIKQEVLNQTVADLSLGGLYVPEFMLKKYYIDQYAKKKFDILLFKPKQVKDFSTKATVTELEKFYQDQIIKGHYIRPEIRQGVVIEFDPARATINVDEIEIEGYYNEHKNQYIKEKPQVAVRIISGDKAELSKLTNQDKNSLAEYIKQNPANVKELAKFTRGTHNPELEKQAFALQKDEVSPVFNDGKQDVVVQLIDRFPTTYKSLTEVFSDVKKEVIKQKIATVLADFNQTEVAQIIKDLGGIEKAITVDNPNESFVAQNLFNINLGEFAKILNKLQIVRLDKIIPQELMQFKDIKQKIADDYGKFKAQEELNAVVNKALQEAKTETMSQLAKKYNVELISTGSMVVGDNNWEKVAEKLTIDKNQPNKLIAALNNLNELNQLVVAVDDMAIIAKLVDLQVTTEDYAAKKELIRADLLRNLIPAIEGGFIASLERNAKIKINEQILRSK